MPQDAGEAIAAELHFKRGQRYYRAGRTEQAIEELYSALSVREIYYDAQLLLGRSLVAAERYREAAAVLREIESRERMSPEVQKLLAKANYETNRLDEASRNLYLAIGYSRSPDYDLHYLKGLIKLRQGDAEVAIIEAKRAIAIKPRFSPAHKLLSDAYLMGKDFDKAESELKLYLSGVRDRSESAEIKERINAIRSFGSAKPERAVHQPIVLPRIYRIPRPAYTAAAHRYKVEGIVEVTALFGKDGAIQYALVTRGLGFGLDEEAIKAARRIEFKAGEVNGQPTSMWIAVKITFKETNTRKTDAAIPRDSQSSIEGSLSDHPDRIGERQ
jgi:TonB family protein